MSYGLDTKCIHLEEGFLDSDLYGAVSFPIFQTATFAHRGLGQSTGYDYSRVQNPTKEQLERIVCQLEDGEEAIAFASGMSAITTLMDGFDPGDHLIVESDLYGGTTRLFEQICCKNGITFDTIDFSADDMTAFIRPETKAAFIESPTNPTMRVVDITKIAEICHSHGLLLIVDNTFMSPYFMNPLKLGADIVIHSGTKYLGGHNDTLAGFLIAGNRDLAEQYRYLNKVTGAALSPFDCWLVLRGIQTLGLRMERASSNADTIARWLKDVPHVTRVLYPGLETHPGHDIMASQCRGYGAMVSFEVDSVELAHRLLNNVKLIRFAESLGGTESLITYPITQTHSEVDPKVLKQVGITDRFLRLSTGIESVDDLIGDLEQAFKS